MEVSLLAMRSNTCGSQVLNWQGSTTSSYGFERPKIHARFTGRTLSIITIRTNDLDLIEDMFSRLDEAVPLNAAEKRNAFGGPLPPLIRDLVKDDFFADRVAISSCAI